MDIKRGRVFALLVIIGIFIIFFSTFTSAGFFDWVKKTITGEATSDTATINLTVGNNAPQIEFVDNNTIGVASVTESNSTNFTFYFVINDTDGVVQIDDNSVTAYFQRSGETTRSNNTCRLIGDIDSFRANYSCSVDLWYWDGAGIWTVNVTANDTNGASVENSTTQFNLQEDTCAIMAPTALTWSSLSVTAPNQSSNNDPILVNNTCNDDIDSGNVRVNALDLEGETTTTDYIYAGNFTVGIAVGDSGCGGTAMSNGSTTGVVSSILTAGNNSINAGDTTSGQEELYFCVTALNPDISSQSYSSGAFGAWTVDVV